MATGSPWASVVLEHRSEQICSERCSEHRSERSELDGVVIF